MTLTDEFIYECVYYLFIKFVVAVSAVVTFAITSYALLRAFGQWKRGDNFYGMLCKLRLCVIYDVNYFLSKPKTGSWCHPLWFKFIVTAMSSTGNECVDKTRTSSRNNIHLFPNSVYIYIYKRQNLYIYIYIKRQNIYVCMSSHLLRNYWTEFNQFLHPP